MHTPRPRSRLAPALLALTIPFAAACDDGTDPGPVADFTLEVAHAFDDVGLADDDFITGFDFAPDGTLWAITFQGVIVRSGARATTTFDVDAIVGVEDAALRDLFIDGQGRPWVAAAGAAAVYDAGEWSVEGPDDLMGIAPKAWAVAVNADGDVLVGIGDATAGGVFLRQGTSWQLFTPESSGLGSRLTNDIAVAPDGSFWVAHGMLLDQGGVSRIAEDAIVATYTIADGLLYGHVDALSVGDDRLWLGYHVMLFDEMGPDGGIQAVPLDGGVIDAWFPHVTDRVSSRVRSLTWTSAGELWFVTGLDQHPQACPECFSGVGRLDPDGSLDAISYRDTDLAPNEFLTAIREGPDGEVYVALAARREIARVVR